MPNNTCTRCKLCKGRRNVVQPTGPISSPVWFIGEAPGQWEDRNGTSFFYRAPAGKEIRYLTNRVLEPLGYTDATVHYRNIVWCRPPKNRDPEPDEIAVCSKFLERDLQLHPPRLIVTVGRISTQWFLGDVSMEYVHGIPHVFHFHGSEKHDWAGIPLLPVVHPAAGLRSQDRMIQVWDDFQRIPQVLKGELTRAVDQYPERDYWWWHEPSFDSAALFAPGETLAVDTETTKHGAPLFIQISDTPGRAVVVDLRVTEAAAVKDILESSFIVYQNAIFDQQVLNRCGINPTRYVDNMVAAYLLQDEPQGLKPLAFRHLGIKMQTYKSMVAAASQRRAYIYMLTAFARTWPDPVPRLVWEKGRPRMKKPWNMKRKLNRIFNDMEKNPDLDLVDRWKKIPLDEGRGNVEDAYGPLLPADLGDIDPQEAMFYAAQDADLTLRIYPILLERIKSHGLEPVLDMDMAIIPMVIDMERGGMPVNPDRILELDAEYEVEQEKARRAVLSFVPAEVKHRVEVNLSSDDQVRSLLTKTWGLTLRDKTPTGKVQVDDAALAKVAGKHPGIFFLRRYNMLDKLRDTYTIGILRYLEEDGCLHPQVRITRTATGRLCVSPDTLIEMPRDMERFPAGIPLHEVKEGDLVYSFDYRKELCLRRVKWVGPTKFCATVVVRYKGDTPDAPILTLTLSPDHLVRLFGYRQSAAWTHAADLRVGSRLLCMPPRFRTDNYFSFFPHSRNRANGSTGGGVVLSIEPGPLMQLWDMEVEDTHTFIGNEVALHNSTAYPNLMAMPTRTSEGKALRTAFQAPPGHTIVSSDYCLAGDTKVLTSEGPVPIKRLKVGHRVLSVKYGKKRTLCFRPVTAQRRTGNGVMDRLVLENGSYVDCTAEHKWHSLDGHLEKTRALGPGRRLLHVHGRDCYHTAQAGNHKVAKVLWNHTSGDFYTITVEDTHNYVLENGLVSANSQIEMRVLAEETQDPNLLRIFAEDLDIHSETAAAMFKIPLDQVDKKKHRYPAKRTGFGIVYGISAEGLYDLFLAEGATGWTVQACQELIDSWYDAYPAVRSYNRRKMAQARSRGYITDMWGRLRRVPGVMSTSKKFRAESERQAGNQPIQSGAQGVIKKAMARLTPFYQSFNATELLVRPLLQIHDDLLFLVRDDILEEFRAGMQEIMEGAVTFSIVTPVDPQQGPSWGELK